MRNLLKETINAIHESGHVPEDIVFIGSEESGHSCSWDEFKILANEIYNSGFGGQNVAMDLIIAFADGQKMWRGEYDGSEWWEVQRPFKKPLHSKKIKNLFASIGWDTLEKINNRG